MSVFSEHQRTVDFFSFATVNVVKLTVYLLNVYCGMAALLLIVLSRMCARHCMMLGVHVAMWNRCMCYTGLSE